MTDGYLNQCKKCKTSYQKEYRELNPAQVVRATNRWRRANPEKHREYQARWRNKPSTKHTQRAALARYRSNKLQRTPSWLTEDDHFIIAEIYDLCQQRTKCTGVPHEVDHIIPLQGELVSGLHVPDNLQVLTAYDNHVKSNSYSP